LCWVFAADANAWHIHLTFHHLHLWSSGIMGKCEGVTLQHPPNDRLFDLAAQSNADVTLLVMQHGCETSNQPNIMVNLAGLADLVQPLRDHAINAPGSPAISCPPKLPAKMSLGEFIK
jgi:hypothetical protein